MIYNFGSHPEGTMLHSKNSLRGFQYYNENIFQALHKSNRFDQE